MPMHTVSDAHATDAMPAARGLSRRRSLTRSHKSALYSIRNFWKVLLHSEVSFRDLGSHIKDIQKAQARGTADRHGSDCVRAVVSLNCALQRIRRGR